MLDAPKMQSPAFEIRPSDSGVGAEVLRLDLSKPIDEAAFEKVSAALNGFSVVCFRDQILTPEQHIAFSRRFGPLQVNVRSEFNKPGYPGIYIVSNVLVGGKPIGSQDAGRYWHSDLCYLQKPSRASLLYALEVPQRDGVSLGDTLFASAWAAYEDLPSEVKRRVEGLRAVNSYNAMYDRKASEFGIRPHLTDEEKRNKYPEDAVHPVVRTHPVTDRKCIYVCEGYTTRILDVSDRESQELLNLLFAQVTKPQYVYRHKWRVGDLLMWDNCAVQHLASFDYALPLRRLMERVTVEGSVPY